MKVFGKLPPGSPGDFEPIDTPVGLPCDYCDTPIEEGDSGAIVPSTGHPNVWAPQHAFCQAIEAYQQMTAWRDQAVAWAALWKRAAKRYRGDLAITLRVPGVREALDAYRTKATAVRKRLGKTGKN